MAKVSVSEAVQLTGIPKSNIYRDISDGKVSATTDEKNKKVIDTAELARVYGDLQYPMQSENGKDGNPTWDDLGKNGKTGKQENSNSREANNKVIAVLEEQVTLLKNSNWKTQRNEKQN